MACLAPENADFQEVMVVVSAVVSPFGNAGCEEQMLSALKVTCLRQMLTVARVYNVMELPEWTCHR